MGNSMLGQQLELLLAYETKYLLQKTYFLFYMCLGMPAYLALWSQIALKPESQGAVNQHVGCWELNSAQTVDVINYLAFSSPRQDICFHKVLKVQ